MSEITDVGAAYDKQFERVSDTETVLREFYDKAYAAGVAKERERCALVCERNIDAPAGTYQILMAAAAKIRKGE
jgi:predicted hydrolase (HD superfamily)